VNEFLQAETFPHYVNTKGVNLFMFTHKTFTLMTNTGGRTVHDGRALCNQRKWRTWCWRWQGVVHAASQRSIQHTIKASL
jgi:hypothetical protein